MPGYYDRDGIPMTDVLDWARSFETSDRRVALTKITGDSPPKVIEVSTVFLGIDHSFGDGPPLLFETMTFGDLGDDGEVQERYSTEVQAKEGHARVVVEVAAQLSRPVVLDVDPKDAPTGGRSESASEEAP